jgi:murein hydrolase activator
MRFRLVPPPTGISLNSPLRRKSRVFHVIIIVLALLWCQSLVVPFLVAGETGAIDYEKNKVNNFRIKIRRLQQGILNKEDQIFQSETKEQNILAELESLDKKIIQQQEKFSELETKMLSQQALIEREETALNKIKGEKVIVEEHLKKRIVAYYTMGDIGLLNVTFSTQTLPELLTFHDAFETLIKYDQNVIKVYKETIGEMERTKNALDLEKAVLQGFIAQAGEEKELLEAAKDEKHILLTQVRTQTKLHKQAIQEMQQASDELNKSIVDIKSKYQSEEKNFAADKGVLRPPVDGTITSLFQQEKVNKLGISRKSMGIELQAPDGTNIIAISDGEVLYADYLRGYGNTVILHHGLQYYTVTSRIEKILVEKGQKVKKDEPIGIIGNTATLFDDGIYFEIRHNNQPLDPLLWLNPNRLNTSNNHTAEPRDNGSDTQ